MLKQGKRHRHRILANASPLQAISLMHLSALLLVVAVGDDDNDDDDGDYGHFFGA